MSKKAEVLNQLNQEKTPVSLIELLNSLGGRYPMRSLRRWLNEAIEEGLVEKTGRKKGTKYFTVRSIQSTEIQRFGSISQTIIEQIQRPLYKRAPVMYAEEWFDSYHPNQTHYVPLHLRNQLHKMGRRFSEENPAGTYAHQIFDRLLIDLSYNSSRLEGNTYSLLDTQKLILEGTGADGKLDEEKTMILNHKEAIHYLVDHAPHLNISKETIFTLHYLLSDGLIDNRYAGKVRDHGVRIGGSTYIPLENPDRLRLLLERVVDKAAKIKDPYEQSLFLLVHITYLQAFSDVNKRTARLSANIPLITNNLVPLSFNDVEKEDYTSAIIAIYELQNVQPIVDLYLFSYMRTCKIYDLTVQSIGFDEIRVRYRQQRRALIREIISKVLIGDPMRDYVQQKTEIQIPQKDQSAFLVDVIEDLDRMDQSRIVGLGISIDQLANWLAKSLETKV